jgi:hypothetical protein
MDDTKDSSNDDKKETFDISSYFQFETTGAAQGDNPQTNVENQLKAIQAFGKILNGFDKFVRVVKKE